MLGLIMLHAALTTVLVLLSAADSGHVGASHRLLGLTALFALVGLLPMHLELGRSACTFTLVEGVLVLALFNLGPVGVVVTATLGEAIACLTHRQSPIKVAYNAAATSTAAAVAALAFAAVGGATAHGTAAYGCALLATAAFAVCNHASTSLVLAVTGEGRFEDVFLVSASMAALASAVSGSIGLAVKALSGQGWAAPLLLVPLIAVVGLETRRAATQRAERLRFERLYSASARSTGLQGFEAALSQAAGEARMLVTGASAVCCAPDREGVWRGMVVDDEGPRAAAPDLVDATVALVGHAAGEEVPVDDLPVPLRRALPRAHSAVVAGTAVGEGPGQAGGIALAVFREMAPDDQGEVRARVLWAFVFHAALITTNALLFERVEDALRHQLDLNRQKDEFLAAVSHELRTPLASVLGSVETLHRLEGRLDGEARERFFTIAQRQGKRLQRLIEELLLTAAVEHRQELVLAEPVDVCEVLAEVAEDLAGAAHGRIVVECDPAVTGVLTDPHKLRQILTNLVENAAKYAPVGLIEVDATAEAERVGIRVVDHGPGIAATDRERVFERFVQLDGSSTRAQGGTGLGLYLCAQVAELLEAELDLSETPGGGATFTLWLPRVPANLPASVDREAADAPPGGAQSAAAPEAGSNPASSGATVGRRGPVGSDEGGRRP
ncbi:MAG: sensor histidine kinase [Acidimicrobiales bacterium]